MNAPHPIEAPRAGLHEILRMAAPIIVGSFSFTIMQFVDQWMVSWLGKEALAAVGSAGVWSFLLATFFLGVVGCVATFVSQCLGRGEKQKCAQYAWQGAYLSVGAGLTALVLFPLSGSLFGWMRHSPEVTRLETIYFQVRLLGFGFIVWQAALSSFFQAVSRPRIPMVVALIANTLNIILDYLLIFGKLGFPKWGIGGAALATVISLIVQCVLLQWIFLSAAYDQEFRSRTAYRLDLVKVRELLRIGWPSGLTFFLDMFNWAIFTSYLVGRSGDAALAAHSAAINYMHVSFMPVVGLNHAVAPIVGQWIGRGRVETAKARTYTAMKLAIAYMFTMGLGMATFAPQLLRVFSSDPEVLRVGRIILILAATFQAFDAVNIVTMGALRGAGDTRFMMWAFLGAGYAFFLPLAYVLAVSLKWGAIGAWVGATCYIIGLSGVLFLRFYTEGWRHVQIFERDSLEPSELPETES